MPDWTRQTLQLIRAAFDEDLGDGGDITSQLLSEDDAGVVANVVPRSPGVICGLALAPQICACFAERLTQPIEFASATRDGSAISDGERVEPGHSVGTLRGPRAAILATERTLLNFLGRMSGVATLTWRYVEAARSGNADAQVLDTRKTLPGWRELDKYAVRCGGGVNHRLGLYDAVLIKDNHLAGIPVARLTETLTEQLRNVPPTADFVEIEVDSLAQLREVLRVSGVDYVLLDNFSLEDLRAAVALRDEAGKRGQIALEASGNVNLETIAAIAATGVDRISSGALTHSATNFDIGLDFSA